MGLGPPNLWLVPHVAPPTPRSAGVSTPTSTNWYALEKGLPEASHGCTVMFIFVD